MSIVEKWILSILASLAVLLVGFTVFRITRTVPASKLPPPELVTIASPQFGLNDEQRDFLGDRSASYTLVEFADYQCPPCRLAHKQLPKVLQRHSAQLRFDFRNFPLQDIHPYALRAAILAETQRRFGTFWGVHDKLMEHDSLDENVIKSIAQETGASQLILQKPIEADAKRNVVRDIELAETLQVNATPTFFLICPDRRVYRLSSPDQVDELIKP